MLNLLGILAVSAGMLAVGWLVWRGIQKQDRGGD